MRQAARRRCGALASPRNARGLAARHVAPCGRRRGPEADIMIIIVAMIVIIMLVRRMTTTLTTTIIIIIITIIICKLQQHANAELGGGASRIQLEGQSVSSQSKRMIVCSGLKYLRTDPKR